MPPAEPLAGGLRASVGSEIVDPAQYLPAWLIFAVALAVLTGLLIWVILHFTRRSEEKKAVARGLGTDDAAKAEYLRAIARIEALVAEGRVTEREAHLRLAEVLRRFLRAAGGIDPQRADLDVLRGDPRLGRVADVLHRLDEPTYSRSSHTSLAASCRAAKEAIRSWS